MTSKNSTTGPTQASGLQDWQAWRARRLASVSAPTGQLALIETRWSPPEITVEEALIGQPSTVIAVRQERTDFDGKVIATGVRLWDSNSPGIQAFDTIEIYAYDPSWAFEATFTPYSKSRPVPFEYVRENPGPRNLPVPGEISVEIKGARYKFDAYDDEGTLILSFADPTNGIETYPAGRFLVLPKKGPDKVIIDFNRAYVPPCGFSWAYNCPLPPPQNRLKIPIHAGEKNPVFRNNYEIH
jgi:uncharacterized protein (DUF1684 family)